MAQCRIGLYHQLAACMCQPVSILRMGRTKSRKPPYWPGAGESGTKLNHALALHHSSQQHLEGDPDPNRCAAPPCMLGPDRHLGACAPQKSGSCHPDAWTIRCLKQSISNTTMRQPHRRLPSSRLPRTAHAGDIDGAIRGGIV